MPEATFYSVTQPMDRPFGHAAHQHHHASSVVMTLEHDGLVGMGECAPRPWVTGETPEEILEQAARVDLHALSAIMAGTSAEALIQRFTKEGVDQVLGLPDGNNLSCLFELAILDLLAQREKVSVAALIGRAHGWPLPLLKSSRVDYSEVIALNEGSDLMNTTLPVAGTYKLKVTEDIRLARDQVMTIRQAVGPKPMIIVDANMSWDRGLATQFANAFKNDRRLLLEEPLPKGDYNGLARLRRETLARVMLDESLCSIDDAMLAVAKGACDAFNIRVAKCGGLLPALKIIRFARQQRINFQIGVQVAEVGPLIAAERQLALMCPDFITIEAGQYDRFFQQMVVTPVPPVDRVAHRLTLEQGIGLGVAPTPLLEDYRHPGDAAPASS